MVSINILDKGMYSSGDGTISICSVGSGGGSGEAHGEEGSVFIVTYKNKNDKRT